MSRIIIAEDENLINDYISKCLDWDELGITEVYTCSNGEEALNLIKEHGADIVLTDINMPKLNGLDLIKHAKLLFDDIRFIILSGYNDFHLVKEAFKLGVSDYILKSELSVDELKKIITAVLETKSESNAADNRNLYLMKESRLKELLWGAKSINDDDKKYQFRFLFENFCVAVFKIVNLEEILQNDWNGEIELLKYGLFNLINEILYNFNFGEAVLGYDDEICFVFSLSDSKNKNDITKIINEIKKSIILYFNFKFRIGISGRPNTDLKILYKNAQAAADYCFVEDAPIVDYEESMKKSGVNLYEKNFADNLKNTFSPIIFKLLSMILKNSPLKKPL